MERLRVRRDSPDLKGCYATGYSDPRNSEAGREAAVRCSRDVTALERAKSRPPVCEEDAQCSGRESLRQGGPSLG